jgi:hypothetical protein
MQAGVAKSLQFLDKASLKAGDREESAEIASPLTSQERSGLECCITELRKLAGSEKRAVWSVQAHLLLCWTLLTSDSRNSPFHFPMDDLDAISFSTSTLILLLEGLQEPIITGLILSILPPSLVTKFLNHLQRHLEIASNNKSIEYATALFITLLFQRHNKSTTEIAAGWLDSNPEPSSRLVQLLRQHLHSESAYLSDSAIRRTGHDSGRTRIPAAPSALRLCTHDVQPSETMEVCSKIPEERDIALCALECGQKDMLFPAWVLLFESSRGGELISCITQHLVNFFELDDSIDSEKEDLFGRFGELVLKESSFGGNQMLDLLKCLLACFKSSEMQRDVIIRFYQARGGVLGDFRCNDVDKRTEEVAGLSLALVELFNKITDEPDPDVVSSLAWLSLTHPLDLSDKFVEQMANTKGSAGRLARFLALTPLPYISVGTSTTHSISTSNHGAPTSILMWSIAKALSKWEHNTCSSDAQSVATNLLACLQELTDSAIHKPLIAPIELVTHIIKPRLALATSPLLTDACNGGRNGLGTIKTQLSAVLFYLAALHQVQSDLQTSEFLKESTHMHDVIKLVLKIDSIGAVPRSLEGPRLTSATSKLLLFWNSLPSLQHRLQLTSITQYSWTSLSLLSRVIKPPLSTNLDPETEYWFLPRHLLQLLLRRSIPSTLCPELIWNCILASSTTSELATLVAKAFKTQLTQTFRRSNLKQHLLLGATSVFPQLCPRGFATCIQGLFVPLCEWPEFTCSWEQLIGVDGDRDWSMFRAYHCISDITMALARDTGLMGSSVYGEPILAERTMPLWMQCLENTLAFASDIIQGLSSTSNDGASSPLALFILTYITVTRIWGPMVFLRSAKDDLTWATLTQKPRLLVLDLFKRIHESPAKDAAECEACSKIRETVEQYGKGVLETSSEDVGGMGVLMRFMPVVKTCGS